jgi:exodeoxyribonuclease V gamma subunit
VLILHQSNRLEALATRLAHETRTPFASAFAPEIVIVQSHGVARWLALQLARHNGVCANVRFPFPIAFASELYRAVDPAAVTPLYDRDVLTWRVMQVLPPLEKLPSFTDVRRYVNDDPLRRFELARRLAATYEQYLIYRPDWIARWEREEPDTWQGILWNRLVGAAGASHRAALQRSFLEGLDAAALARAGIPERISVFGAPALPPMLLELLAALAGHIDVHLYIMNPCREYWGDIAAAGEIARKRIARRADSAFLESGNPLLASLGKQGRDFVDLIQSHTFVEDDQYCEPGSGSLLAALQSDVLNLKDRVGGDVLQVGANDRSVQVHACHSAMREVEVLHDQLLAMFEADRALQPSDVVVMTPDIESYAPYIEAVFASNKPTIPYTISDRSTERDSPLAATFMALLDLPGSRYEAAQILAILDEPAVQCRFELQTEDLDLIHHWMCESGIRWGIDAVHRAGFGVPATAEHTWRFGLDRLLLGYALPGAGESTFEGIAPYDDVEGSLGQILGRFVSFAESVIRLNALPASRTVPQWSEIMHGVLAEFFNAEETRDEEVEMVRAAITTLASRAEAAGFGGTVSLDVIKSALRAALEVPGRGFLSGGVTFCAMVPMRSLPFKVVCLIGLNNGAFPRMRRIQAFDLMESDFRKGDRSRRDDDRYLFLESMLSARSVFYISYTGQHIRDNSVIPPSVLVSELLDHIARGFCGPAGRDVREHLLVRHPLQPFSPRYFSGETLFSYSATLCQAANTAGRGSAVSRPPFSEPLPEPDDEWRTVTLASFIRFFMNPARYFLRERVGIRLDEAEEEVAGREPFTSDGLGSYELKQRVLAMRMQGTPMPEMLLVARGSGLLPHAQVGAVAFQETSELVESFAGKLREALPEITSEPLAIDIATGPLRLQGALTGLSSHGLIGYRLANCQPKDLFDAWIRHLVLNAVQPPGVDPCTRWLLQDATLRFSPVLEARGVLEDLARLYWRGLSEPLKFFPKSAKTYVEKTSLEAARGVWDYSEHKHGEGKDRYYLLAFRGCDPLDSDFEQLSQAVFGPMMRVMTVDREDEV